jgi:hypothetical protein
MFTSFGALVYIGLKFNERQTNPWVKWFLAFPMFSASVASRAFTLAVFLKETTLGLQMSNANPGFILTKLKGSPNQILFLLQSIDAGQ